MKRNSPFRANGLSHAASPVIEMALQPENADGGGAAEEDPKPENCAGVSFSRRRIRARLRECECGGRGRGGSPPRDSGDSYR
jgi:hypothetical protein